MAIPGDTTCGLRVVRKGHVSLQASASSTETAMK